MNDHGGQTLFHHSGDKLHIKLASAAIDRGAAAGMDAVHIREIQLYSYNQLQFLTGVLVAGGRREGCRRSMRGKKSGSDCAHNAVRRK